MMRTSAKHQSAPRVEKVQIGAAPYRGAPIGTYPTPDSALVELRALIRHCGKAYGFTLEEHAEALQAAMADPEASLTCFRAIARELDPAAAPQAAGSLSIVGKGVRNER